MSRAKGCFPEIHLKITKITNYINYNISFKQSQKGLHFVDDKQSFLGFGGEDILATISPCWIHVVTLSAVQARKGKQKVIFQLSTQSWWQWKPEQAARRERVSGKSPICDLFGASKPSLHRPTATRGWILGCRIGNVVSCANSFSTFIQIEYTSVDSPYLYTWFRKTATIITSDV